MMEWPIQDQNIGQEKSLKQTLDIMENRTNIAVDTNFKV